MTIALATASPAVRTNRHTPMLRRSPHLTITIMLTVATFAATPALAADPSPGATADTITLPGGRIAFGRFNDAIDDFELFMMASDGSDEQPLLPGPHECPQWSPDGTTLAITALTPAGQVVPAFINPDGSGYRELSVDPTLNLGCAAWSPDGASLMYEAWDDTDPARAGIYTIRASDGGGLTRLTQGHDIPGSYSPEGRSIVFTRTESLEPGLWVMEADGSNPRRLFERTDALGSFSPDGTMILADVGYGTVLTVHVGSGQVAEVPLPADSNAHGAYWSPDGEWIAFSMHVHGEPNADIYVVRLDGTGLAQLTATPDAQEEWPTWVAP